MQDVCMELDSFYERLKLAAAAKLHPWHEHQEGSSYHIWVAGMTINIAEDIHEEQQKRLIGLIDYQRDGEHFGAICVVHVQPRNSKQARLPKTVAFRKRPVSADQPK
jgi:hypothetical protein